MLAFCKALCYDKDDPCSRLAVQNHTISLCDDKIHMEVPF